MMRFSPNPNRAYLIHWQEWGVEAFQKAQEQDKPLMLFLTAFWCGFCQRMDEGAFSDDENLALLNAYFIAVRAENAKRPDVDARYNLNGWPTIAFMTAQGELLAAANYLASEEFKSLLVRVYMTYEDRKNEIPTSGIRIRQNFGMETARVGFAQVNDSSLSAITQRVMELADRVHGGYGRGQKFIHPEANDFLLSRYEATRDAIYLDHVCLTLDRMREGAIHDHEQGGYFRTCSNEDWSQPHREKLLVDQAGLLSNCLHTFRITQRTEYARMAEGIIEYLNGRLSAPSHGAFFGCEDFIRSEATDDVAGGEFFSILDECLYNDANAQAIVAYLEAAALLQKADCEKRALDALEFLWDRCRAPDGGMFHYFDGAAHLPGLLNDQTRVGTALVRAFSSTGEVKYVERAKELAEFILAQLKNPDGGYYDLCAAEPVQPSSRLTLIEQNGAAALFFLKLAEATGELRYREAALWALSAFTGDFSSYGIHAAEFGQALGEFMNLGKSKSLARIGN